MLTPYRILDLADGPGLLVGQLLAQLGAEVISVEPVGGHRSRAEGRYSSSDTDVDGSLWHDAYGRGRVALTGGPESIEALAATADVVIDTGVQGIDLADLRHRHPALITASVTPFGNDGPKAGWVASDLTLAAASGQMVLNGDSDRAPVRISEPQAFHHASIEMAAHIAAALFERRGSGLGQHLDVSAQHALTQATQMQMLASAVGAPLTNRHSGGLKIGSYELRFVYPAVDGFVSITFLFGEMIGRFTQRLMAWVHDAGFCSEEIRDLDYVRFFELIYSGALDIEALNEATDSVARYTSTLTKAQLFQVARDEKLLIAPVATASELVGLDHFEVRDFWEEHPRTEGGEPIRFPGPWARPTSTPLRPLGAPPAVGADDERRDRLLGRVPEVGEAATASGSSSVRRPLDGMKILDFSWVLAGPMATRMLADLGATVVRIESELRPDVIRAAGPFLAGLEGGDATALWHSAAAGKMSLQLDVTSAAGLAVVLELAEWADLAFESFSAGTLERLGFGHDVLSANNPALVTVSTSLMGQSGPLADYAGFGNLAAALTGFFEVTGWPDRPPAGPFTAYTDYVSPRFAALAAVAAVDHARRTGVGQYIDLCQAESAAHLLAPALLMSQTSGRDAARLGNRDTYDTPSGVFPASGDDQWIAITCASDSQWGSLAELTGAPRLAGLSRTERLARQDELEELIAVWTAAGEAELLTEQLQAAGICAHPVQQSDGVLADAQLVHRGFAQEVPHPKHGTVWVEGSQGRWSRTQPGPRFGGPPVGEHTQHVLSSILGYSDEKIAELVIEGAIA